MSKCRTVISIDTERGSEPMDQPTAEEALSRLEPLVGA